MIGFFLNALFGGSLTYLSPPQVPLYSNIWEGDFWGKPEIKELTREGHFLCGGHIVRMKFTGIKKKYGNMTGTGYNMKYSLGVEILEIDGVSQCLPLVQRFYHLAPTVQDQLMIVTEALEKANTKGTPQSVSPEYAAGMIRLKRLHQEIARKEA